MDFTYKRKATRDFTTTVEAVERCIGAHGFAVARIHDMQSMVASKGFEIQPLKIYELVSARYARGWHTAERDLVYVCRLHVYAEGDAVFVSALRPTALSHVMAGLEDDEYVSELERDVERLVDDAVG
ncbi:MAG: DUF302 domain-containing protein [Anaerosomatales bacterium]|nr:DUF302 domain-containing protein [Anaerosomatales bacterium]